VHDRQRRWPKAPVYDSNRYTLFGMLTPPGLRGDRHGRRRDDPALLEATFREAAAAADVVITSGGVSVGEADFIKRLMAQLGEVLFWKIAMKPGRPMAFGRIGPRGGADSAWLFGLPGNPVAVMVTFYQFVRPALLRLMPAPIRCPSCRCCRRAAAEPEEGPGRTEFLSAASSARRAGAWSVRPTGAQGSGVLRSMADANCFIVLEHERGKVAAGDVGRRAALRRAGAVAASVAQGTPAGRRHGGGVRALPGRGRLFGALLEALDYSRVAVMLHEIFVIGSGMALFRLLAIFVFRIDPAARRHRRRPHRRGHHCPAGLRRFHPGPTAHCRPRSVEPADHFGGDHRRARLRDAGYPRQCPVRRRAAARQFAAYRRLDQARRPYRPGGADPLAADDDPDAQRRSGGRSQQPVDAWEVHRLRPGDIAELAVATLGVVQRHLRFATDAGDRRRSRR
jgi:molybdenum cofactor synthesis domain-containing protein